MELRILHVDFANPNPWHFFIFPNKVANDLSHFLLFPFSSGYWDFLYVEEIDANRYNSEMLTPNKSARISSR